MVPRTPVAWFAQQMERVLHKHDAAKGEYGFLGEDPNVLFQRLSQEAEELRQALETGENIIGEAVDVANFALMIAFNHFIRGGQD